MSKLNKDFYQLYCEEVAKNKVLKNEIAQLKRTVLSLTQEIDYLRKNHDKIIETKVNAAVKKATHAFEQLVTLYSYLSCLSLILKSVLLARLTMLSALSVIDLSYLSLYSLLSFFLMLFYV